MRPTAAPAEAEVAAEVPEVEVAEAAPAEKPKRVRAPRKKKEAVPVAEVAAELAPEIAAEAADVAAEAPAEAGNSATTSALSRRSMFGKRFRPSASAASGP